MPHNSLRLEEVSTPSSDTSSLSYLGSNHNGFVDNNFMTSEDPRPYHVPVDEASDMTSWPETYSFA
jgi:hypothetical protein